MNDNWFSHLMCLIIIILFALNVNAQSERKLVRDGNKQYKSGKFSDAETNYRKSLDKNKSSFTGTYNLGDALYKQKKYEEAAYILTTAQHYQKIKIHYSEVFTIWATHLWNQKNMKKVSVHIKMH